MRDNRKTKAELLQEVKTLRNRVAKLTKKDIALRLSDQKWYSLLKNTPDIVMIVDREGTIHFINHTVPGITIQETIGKKVYDYISPGHHDMMKKHIKRVFQSGQSISHEISGLGRNGDLSWYQAELGPIKQNGHIVAASIITRDITEHKKLELTLQQKTEHLSERIKELNCLYGTSKLMEQTDRSLEEVLNELVHIIPQAWQYPVKTCARIIFRGREFQTDNFNETPWKQCADITVYERKAGSIEVFYLDEKPTIYERLFLKEEKELLNALAIRVGRFIEHKKVEENLRESEERYRTLFQCAAEGIIVADIETMKFKYVNPAICKMLGYTEEEFKEFSLPDIHPKEDLEYVISEFKAQAKGGKILSSNIPCLRKDGTITNAEVNTTNILIDGRECNVGFFTDITERKKAEEEIEKFKKMADRATHGCAMSDLKGNLTYINDSFADMHGYTPPELIGKNLRIFHTNAQMKRVRQINKKLADTGQGFKGEEVWHVRRDGTEFPTLMNNWILQDSNGKPYLMCATAVDITERKKVQEKIRKNEERYRILVENQTDMVVKFDKNGVLLFVSPSYCNTFGKSQDELIGSKFMPLIHEEDREKVVETLKKVYKPPYTGYVEERALTKDGWRWQAWLSTAVLNNKKKVESVIGVGRDITEQKRLEQTLRESEEKYRTVVESAGESIAIFDKNGTFLFINERGAKQLGGKPKDLIGKTMWDLFPKKIADRQAGAVRKVIRKEKELKEDTTTLLRGQSRWYNTTLVPIRNSSGKINAALVMARDVHEQKLAEKALTEYNKKMAQAEQLAQLGTLSSIVAHQFAQPLTTTQLSMDNALAKLQKGASKAAVAKKIRDGLKAVSNLTSILRMFQMHAGIPFEKNPSQVNLKTVAERIFLLLKESARRAKVNLYLKDMDKITTIYSYEKDLEHIFFALVENAIQGTSGKKSSRLVISGTMKDKQIELRFRDTCGGIAKKNIDKIFEPFFTTKPLSERTGLGLYTVELLLSRIGGKIRVESRRGKGSTFYLSLPVKADGIE